MSKSYARIDALTATEANQAIIFRRGPRNQTQMLLWNFNTDDVIPGQWINSRVFTRRSDVSPDGKYVALFVRGQGEHIPQHAKKATAETHEDTYISISRPPYFSALGLWFCSGSYGGAGIWKDNRTFHAHPDPYSFRNAIQPPNELKVLRKQFIRDPEFNIFRRKLAQRQWIPSTSHGLKSEPITVDEVSLTTKIKVLLGMQSPVQSIMEFIGASNAFSKSFAGGLIRYQYKWKDEYAKVLDNAGKRRLEIQQKDNHPLWIDTDNSGRLVYADKGCLYAWKDFPKGKPQLIADLNPNKFENIPPPDWALKP